MAATAAAGRQFLVGFRPCFGPPLLLQLAHLVPRQHLEACMGRDDEDGGEEGDRGRKGELPVGGPSLRRLPFWPQGSRLAPVGFQSAVANVGGEFGEN